MSEQPYRYWAFISYSHHDLRAATQLHRWLECYAVPSRLVGRASPAGALPRRLFPIFRDRDELPSSSALGGVIHSALESSRHLIVVCSPQAAKSRWVNEEIRQFKALGRADRVFALIVDGEPNALDPERECFPPALRWTEAADGASAATPAEPIAADARRSGDGESLARMKLVSGLLHVGLDELLRRERRRQIQRRLAWCGGLAGATALAVFALVLQRREYAAREHAALLSRLVENGRQELLEGSQMRAAVYLSAAYGQGVDTPALRFMLHQAMQPIDALAQTIDSGAPVRAMKMSADNRTLVTLSRGGDIAAWSMSSGQKLAQFPGLDTVGSSSFCGPLLSEDGRRVALTTLPARKGPGELKVWSLPDGAVLLQTPIAGISCEMSSPFSPDGSKVVGVAVDGRPQVWSLDGGAAGSPAGAPSGAVMATFSPDGRWLAAGHGDGAIWVWRTAGPASALRLSGFEKSVTSVAFDAGNGLLVATAEDGAIRGWTLPDGHLAFAGGHAQRLYAVQLAADAQRLLTIGLDGERVWNTGNGRLLYAAGAVNRFFLSTLRDDGQQLTRVESGQAVVSDVTSSRALFKIDLATEVTSFTRDGLQLINAGPEGLITLWNERFRPLAAIQHGPLVGTAPEWWSPTVSFAPLADGQIVSGGRDGRLLQWAPRDLAAAGSFAELGAAITTIKATPDGKWLAAATVNGDVVVWDTATRQPLRRIALPGQFISALSLSPDGRFLFAADRANDGHLWRIGDGERLADYAMDSRFAVDFSPDSAQLAVGRKGRVEVIDLVSLRPVLSQALAPDSPPVGCIRFTPGADALVAMADDGSGALRWMPLAGGQHREARLSGAGGCFLARVSPDGARVLLLSDDAVSIWDPASARVLKVEGRSGSVYAAAWSPDGGYVVTGSTEGMAQVSDSHDGHLLQNLAVHAGPLAAVDFSRDGGTLYTGGADGRLQAWETRLESRAAAEIARRVACVSPWSLVGTSLQSRDVDLARCFKHRAFADPPANAK